MWYCTHAHMKWIKINFLIFAFLSEMKWKHHNYDIFHIVYTETCIQLKDIKTARFLPIIEKP